MDDSLAVLVWPAKGTVFDENEFDALMKTHSTRLIRVFRENSAAVAAGAVTMLEALDPAVHSYSYLMLLDSILPSGNEALQDCEPGVVDRTAEFLLTFDTRQIRFAGPMFSNLVGKVASGRLMPADVAVHVLAQALLRIDPSGSMLTSNHLSFVRLAYMTDNIQAALPVITKKIIFYPGMANQKDPQRLSDLSLIPPQYISKDTGLTSDLRTADILEYDFCVGLMFCRMRDWSSAQDAFARVTSFPSRDNGVSKITAEAHKRWILVSLLLDGKTRVNFPTHTPAVANRYLSTLNKAYLSLADCFNNMSASQLKKEVDNSQAGFAEDKTEGLVQEVVRAHQKWQIIQLRDVYAKVSISDIRTSTWSAERDAHLADDSEVEQLIEGMIASGMVKAVIRKPDSGPAYLEFFADDELSEAEYAARIAQAAKNIGSMQPVLRATKERMATHRDYIKHLQKEIKRGDNERMDAGFEESIEDEDLMTGIHTAPMMALG